MYPQSYRQHSQVSAPGARQRGMVQNAAITRALGDRSVPEQPEQAPVAGSIASKPPSPAPLGAPTPGVNTTLPIGGRPQISLMQRLGAYVGGMRDVDMRPNRVSPRGYEAPYQPAPPSPSEGDFLRLAQRFSPNQTGLTGLMADQEFRARFPGARIHKNDWVDLGDGSGLIDSVRGFNKDANTGEGWQWLTEADAIAGSLKDQAGQLQSARARRPSHTHSLLQQMALQNALRG